MTSKGKQPPKWVKGFLSNFLDERLLEGSLGDLEEKYSNQIDNGMWVWRANLLYVIEALGFIKLASPKNDNSTSTFGHIFHVLIFFGRLIRKDKSYYLVSMFGLAVSLASFLLIAMFVVDELSYDSIHENRNRVFRLTTHVKISDVDFDLATAQFPAAQTLQAEFPEVEQAMRLYASTRWVEAGDKKIEERIFFADDNFFKVFSFQLLSGDRETILNEPGSMIITRRAALKYFGNENAVGKDLKIEETTLKIVGVIDDIPEQSHLKFEILVSLSTQLNAWKAETGLEGRENKWFWIGAHTYLMLRNEGDEVSLAEKLPAFVKKYFPERFHESRYELQPLSEIHLTSHKDYELEPNGDMLYVKLFSALAIVIMMVSLINMLNLSYFKTSTRIREVGIRKFLGQNSGRIISQLLIETLFSSIVSFLIALVLCQLLLSQFNLVVDKDLQLWTGVNLKLVGLSLLLAVAVSGLAIVRPAAWLAKRPSSFLLLRDYRGKPNSQFRNLLIGLQVGFSFVLLVFSFVIRDQIEFFNKKDLGYDKSNVVVVNINDDIDETAFKEEVKKSSGVVDVTSAASPGGNYDGWRFVPEGGSHEKPVMLPFTFSDASFLQTMKINLLSGKNFVQTGKYDSAWAFLVNKRAAIELGWDGDPVGRHLEVFAPGRTEIWGEGTVVGVIDDYHSASLHEPVKPVVITYTEYSGNLLVRVNEINGETVSSIESTWKKFSDRPFQYSILDQDLDKLYANEEKLGNVMLFFTMIALYLTCYGMFAMSSLLFSSKLKEVAIRKVFGAQEGSIMSRFYGRYAAFNLVAVLMGLPVAIWLGNLWLETFQYRIELSVIFFLKAAGLVLLAGTLSVSYYLAKVAWSNPLPFLRRD